MKIIIRNFITTLKRFKAPVTLNIIGLSVAFATFIIIIMQVMFEYGYDKSHPKHERIYRISVLLNGEWVGIMNKNDIDDFEKVSPHIEQITCIGEFTFFDNHFKVKRDNGSEEIFEAKIREVLPAFKDIFDIVIVEGDSNVLEKPNTLLMPQSMAKRIFGNQSPIGKMFGQYPIGAVYNDFPKNSIIPNDIFATIPIGTDPMNGFNHVAFLTLDSPSNKESVQDLISAKIKEIYKDVSFFNNITCKIQPIGEIYFDNSVKYDIGSKGNSANTRIFLAVAILIIIIASINYINFASALTPVRIKMINMQKILGGNLGTIRLSIMFESMAIVLLSFAMGVFIVEALNSTELPSHFDADLTLSANIAPLLISFIVAVVVGVLSGLHPTFYMTSFPPILALKGAFGQSATGRNLRSVLIGAQYIISIALIISMLLINRQNKYISNFSLGFDKENIVVTKIPLEMSSNKRDLLTSKIEQNANLKDIAFSLFEFGGSENYSINKFTKNGRTVPYNVDQVSYNFLDVLGINVAEGRKFTKSDTKQSKMRIIFNQYSKVADSLELNENINGAEIVGFIGEGFKPNSVRSPNIPFAFALINNVFIPFQFTYIRINKGCSLQSAINSINEVFHEVDPAFTPSLRFMNEVTNQLYQKEKRANYLITAFSLLAITISLIGVFGLVMFETQYRRKEIGVRRVFGASIGQVLKLINSKFVRITIVCFIIASPIAYYIIDKWLNGFAYRTNIPWWIFAIALVTILAITVATVTIRSFNAATEDPVKSIKTE